MDVDFNLTDDHLMVQETARRYAERFLSRIVENDRAGTYDPSLYRELAESGLLGVAMPKKYGGLGLDYISLAIACEEMERVDTSLRVTFSVHAGLCGTGLMQWGTPEQKEKFLAPLASGEKLGGFALTEPNAGSDAAAIESTAVREGDYYILNGEKMWISLADVADTFIFFAYTDKSKGHNGITAFIIERDRPGFQSHPIHGKLGVRAGDTGSIVLQNYRAHVSERLGEEGEGFKIAMSCIDGGRYTVAAGSVGLIRAAKEASIRYAHERRTFGKEIGQHQLVQRMIAHMVAGEETSRLLTYRAGWLKNQGKRSTRETALAKWVATNAAFEAASDAIQIHGAYGYSDEYPVERFLRNAKGAVIYEGTREIQELMQGEYALGYRQDKPLRCPPVPWPFPDDKEA